MTCFETKNISIPWEDGLCLPFSELTGGDGVVTALRKGCCKPITGDMILWLCQWWFTWVGVELKYGVESPRTISFDGTSKWNAGRKYNMVFQWGFDSGSWGSNRRFVPLTVRMEEENARRWRQLSAVAHNVCLLLCGITVLNWKCWMLCEWQCCLYVEHTSFCELFNCNSRGR